MDDRKLITVVDSRLWASVLSDLITVSLLVGVIGIGWFVESPAMELAGFILISIFIVARAARSHRMTAQEAVDHLVEKYGVTPSSVSDRSDAGG